MAKYVDGFIIVVPDSKVAEYTKMAEDIWLSLSEKLFSEPSLFNLPSRFVRVAEAN